MTKIFTSVCCLLLFCGAVFAQSPQAVCYQAVATDAAGTELQGRNIAVRATIIQGQPGGSIVREERHTVLTDDYGLFTLNIGQGAPEAGSPEFSAIDWGMGPFFLKIETDPNGGTEYLEMGITQILSVPYALYSENAGNAQTADMATVAMTAQNDDDTSPDNEIQDLEFDPSTGILSLTQSTNGGVNINMINPDADPTNELQVLLYDAETGELSLTGALGDPVIIDINDADSDPENEIQDLSFDAETGALTLSGTENPGVTIDINDADSDPENEIQDLSFDAETGALTLSGTDNPGVTIDINDADNDPENEIQTLTYEDNILSISGVGGNAVDFGETLFGAPGASMDFPQGIQGQHIVLKAEEFTVPADKTFYLTAGGNSVNFVAPSGDIVNHPNTPNMPVFASGTIINNCRCTGMLITSSEATVPQVLDLTDPTAEYIVPAGQILFVKSGISNAMTGNLKIDGSDMEFLRPNFTRGTRIISFPEGTAIQRPTNSDPGAFILTGYLIPQQE